MASAPTTRDAPRRPHSEAAPAKRAPHPGLRVHGHRVGPFLIAAAVIGVGIHFAFPALAGLERSIELVERADPWWIAVAICCSAGSLACYVAIFRYTVSEGVAGSQRLGWAECYQITMASQAASTVVTAGGAGGIALILWALGRAGLPRAQAIARLVAFLAIHYVIYLGALVVFGLGLWLGLLPGGAPTALTLVPAVVAGLGLLAVAVTVARPAPLERVAASRPDGKITHLAARLTDAPAALADGMRYAASLLQPRSRGLTIALIAVAYWASNLAVLAACFEAFGARPELAGLVQAFFVGMTANLLPLLPGGVGSVEAGLIGALLAFGEPGPEVVVSVLAYRLIGYWLPTIPESIAYAQLTRTVTRWRAPRSTRPA